MKSGAGYVFTALILSDLGDAESLTSASLTNSQIQDLSDRLIMPYIYMAIALSFLIGLVRLAPLPHVEAEEETAANGDQTSILQFPQIILGSVALFAYVGLEVIAGDTIGLFGSNLDVPHFASLTSYTMVFMVIGYIIGVTCIPRFISQEQALIGSAVAGSLCIVGIVISSTASVGFSSLLWGWTSIPLVPNAILFVALMGLAHALVWPAIWPLALEGLGKFTAQGSALLIMGISGGAVLPLMFGKISEAAGDMQTAYWVGLPLYLFIFYYGVTGHKKRNW